MDHILDILDRADQYRRDIEGQQNFDDYKGDEKYAQNIINFFNDDVWLRRYKPMLEEIGGLEFSINLGRKDGEGTILSVSSAPVNLFGNFKAFLFDFSANRMGAYETKIKEIVAHAPNHDQSRSQINNLLRREAVGEDGLPDYANPVGGLQKQIQDIRKRLAALLP